MPRLLYRSTFWRPCYWASPEEVIYPPAGVATLDPL